MALQKSDSGNFRLRARGAGDMESQSPVIAHSAVTSTSFKTADSGDAGSLMPVIWAVVAASFGALAFGFHLGVVNGPLAAIAADLGFAGNAGLQGAVVSTLLAGASAGSLGGSGLADTYGRRGTLIAVALPLVAGAVVSATATSLTGMLTGRILAGLGIGLSSALVPLYISEVAPTRVRGALGSINQLVICIGIVAAQVVNVVLPSTAWRNMFYIAALPGLLLGLGMLAVPESPKWLASKGDALKARKAATDLWGPQGAAELEAAAQGAGEESGAVPLGQLLKNRGVQIGCTLFFLQQFSGVNAIVYFSTSVFEQAGITSSALASAVVGLTNVGGTVLAASLMDRAGRKKLLTLSFTGMGLAMLAMAAGFALKSLASISGTLALLGTVAYILSFALGAGPVPGLLVPEITPMRLRGQAMSAALATHWIFNLAIGQLFLPTLNAIGVSGVYLLFATTCLAAVSFINSQVVETKGLAWEEVELAMAK